MKFKKLEKQVSDCEKKIEKLDEKIVELREAGLLNAPRTTQEIEERRNKWVG